jgi:glutamine synthetase
MNVPSFPVELDQLRQHLEDGGVNLVIGSMVLPCGMTLSKTVPTARLRSFVDSGVGASPSWDVFCIDGGISFTDDITAVGDRRLRLDASALRVLPGRRAWAPLQAFEQDGTAASSCPRGVLRGVEEQLGAAGLQALVGHELEFTLVHPDGAALPGSWKPYGLGPLLDRSAFVSDLMDAMTSVGIALEQFHAEFGTNQFEFSLPPLPPTAAADQVVLAKVMVGITARAHGLAASFSPVPFVGGIGNGAHQHVSFTRDGAPLLSGGDGPHGITAAGGAAIGGIVGALADMQGLLSGSVLSTLRLVPGMWSGAYICWGLENREAAVRFLAGGRSNPHGANIEVKIVDPSANVYAASAAILAAALDGISTGRSLPNEMAGDPRKLTAAEQERFGLEVLSSDHAAVVDRLDSSDLLRRLLGDGLVDVTVAVRRYECEQLSSQTPEALTEQLRLVWSI